MAIPTTENVRLYKDRADAATRLLERRRESLEVAIAALEIVGYKVYQDREGSYRVEPPHDRISKYEAVPEVKPTPQVKAKLLEDYPTMLTVKDVSEIMGFSEGAVRQERQRLRRGARARGHVHVRPERPHLAHEVRWPRAGEHGDP
ncbi:MAG: hypothetical protein Q4A93_03115 [Actinomycetota bacterium]|nr:hypothetical protein [Actinomycetota bacterium]